MKMKSLLAVAVGALLLLGMSCQSSKRFLKDTIIVVGSPLIIPYGAATDAKTDAENVQKGLGGDAVQVFVYPFAFLLRVIDHAIHSTIVHGIDLALYPAFGVQEIAASDNPDTFHLEQLQIYNTGWDWLEGTTRGDAGTGGGR